MRKLIVAILAMVVASGYADLRQFDHVFTIMGNDGSGDGMPDAGVLTGDIGGGAGWAYEIYDATLDDGTTYAGNLPAASVNLGWYDSGGGLQVGGFNFVAPELNNVALTIYNSDNSWSITSLSVLLPDLDDPPPAGSTNVAFDFTGQSWVVPEPATIGLMGIAGLGMFLARKKVRA